MSREALDKLTASEAISFQLNFGGISMAFDRAALLEIQKQTADPVTFSAVQASGLSGEALAAIGSRPAYDLSVSWQKGGTKAEVTNFGAGRVTLALAYTPAAGERVGGLYLVRAGQNGAATWISQSSYDSRTKRLSGFTGQFSIYGVGYKTPPAFADTVNHWAKDDIDFVAGRGLISGTAETAFTPDGPMTRGMVVTALGRLAGIGPLPPMLLQPVYRCPCYCILCPLCGVGGRERHCGRDRRRDVLPRHGGHPQTDGSHDAAVRE